VLSGVSNYPEAGDTHEPKIQKSFTGSATTKKPAQPNLEAKGYHLPGLSVHSKKYPSYIPF
jgi:hypothetical protein